MTDTRMAVGDGMCPAHAPAVRSQITRIMLPPLSLLATKCRKNSAKKMVLSKAMYDKEAPGMVSPHCWPHVAIQRDGLRHPRTGCGKLLCTAVYTRDTR